MICFKGGGEVFLHDRWVEIEAGAVAYLPEGVAHAVRNPASNTRDFVLLTQITPPSFDLYEPAGFYNRAHQRLEQDAITAALAASTPGNLSPDNELHFSELNPELRPWNLSREAIRRQGALFNVFKGAPFAGLSVPMRLILWPGQGARTAGLHTGLVAPDQAADTHSHPSGDDCIFVWEGATEAYLGGEWVPVGPLEGAMAPCGVTHGGRGSTAGAGRTALLSGFGAPAQLDVYMKTDYFRDGV